MPQIKNRKFATGKPKSFQTKPPVKLGPPRKKPQQPDLSHTKVVWKPSTILSPVPVVMVSCMDTDGRPNIVTVAWTGTVCSDPPMLSISLQPIRYSHGIISETQEFVVNIPSIKEARSTDLCGVVSGRDVDKFAHTGLTQGESTHVRAPIIAECPVNIECRIRQMLHLGSHTMFIAEVLAVHVTENLIDAKGRLALERAGLVSYAHGHYYTLGRQLGHFGYSVRKHPKKRR